MRAFARTRALGDARFQTAMTLRRDGWFRKKGKIWAVSGAKSFVSTTIGIT
jgi:hypothetical protein